MSIYGVKGEMTSFLSNILEFITHKLGSHMPYFSPFYSLLVTLFVWGFTLDQQYFIYLMATVHKSMFPGLFLTNT